MLADRPPEQLGRVLISHSAFLLQDTNEIVAIKKFKDSEGRRPMFL